MIACTRCGHDNQEGELVCAQCGTEIDDAGAKALIGETVLGVYRITDILGRGGMSVVYKGTHKLTEQRVALKILPPELAVHAALKTRFLEEAKALARLEHANIVRLYNFGEEAGRFVLAMEYVEGQTFERMVMKHGKVPWALSTRIAVEVLRALEYAHDKGIVHRDIKPSNVLVRSDGSAMVMDFGIAKMTESTRLTATGQTMGTVRYMSPEQVRGQSVNLRTDLYSLGIALFEGIAGDTPFQGDTHFDIMSKHLSEPPPSLRAIVPDVPEALERVIHHAMGKAREDRYQTAAEFRVALEKCLEGVPADPVTPAPSRTATPLPAPLPRAPTPAPPNRAPMTGLASSLEPAFAEIVPSRRRTALWLGLAAAVAAGAAVVIVLMTRGHAGQGQGTAGRNPAGKPIGGAAPDAAGAAPEWPEPRRIPGVTYAVDQRFEGAERVRVLAVHAVDATKLAQTYQHAQQRFGAFVAKQRAGAVIEIHPLNLAVVAPATICEPALYAPDPAPANCANLTFRYDPHSRTLFVAEGDTLESLDIPEGAAVHLCRTTKALDDLICGKTFLVPFDEALEAEMSPPGGPP